MEARRRYRVQVVIAVTLNSLLFVGSSPARAGGQGSGPIYFPPTTTVTTDSNGVNVDSQMTGQSPGISGTGTQASGAPKCYLREVPGSEMTEDLTNQYWAMRMMYAPYYVVCGNAKRGIVWIEISLNGPGTGGTQSQDPRAIALRLRDHMPVPLATVRINPGQGLVGTESWFWIQGYNGAPITDSANAFGKVIKVQAVVTHYEWSFGDGATLTSDTPGQAYPSRSEVRHVYEQSSSGAQSGYGVVVNFVFSVRYRVGNGPWVAIPGITRTAQADYAVRESQAVIGQ
jgi:hypothetical protein